MSDGMFPPAELFEAELARQKAGLRKDSSKLEKKRAEEAAIFAAEAAKRRQATTRFKERPEEYLEQTPQMSDEERLNYLRSTASNRKALQESEESFALEQKVRAEKGLRGKFQLEAFDAGIPEKDWPAYIDKRMAESSMATAEPAVPAVPATKTTPATTTGETTPAEQPPSTTDEIMDGLNRVRMLREEAAEADARAFAALEERQRLQSKKVEDEIASAEQDLKSYSIDPNRAYKSLGSQVAAAFAIAVGAFAEGFTGGRTKNTALKIIESAIARDVESQKAEMMKRKDVLKNKNNVYARMLSRFGNELAAEKATTVLGLRSAIMKTQELINKYPSMANKKVGLESIARMEESRVKILVDLQKLQGRALKGQGKKADTLRLFEQADVSVQKLEGIFLEVADEVEGFMGKFGLVAGELGKAVGLGDVFQSDLQGRFDAQVSNASQSINKAFSGARGSDRDLAAVLMQMPTLKIFFGKNGTERGLNRIKQVQGNLRDAINAQGGGLLNQNDYANYSVNQGLAGREGKKITAEDIDSFMETDEFKRIRDKVNADESAQKKSPQ